MAGRARDDTGANMDSKRTMKGSQQAHPIVDKKILGNYVRGARHTAGYRSQRECVLALAAEGCAMTAWTLGAIERGDRMPSLDEFVALTLLLAPPGGLRYFVLPSVSAENARRLTEISSQA